MPNLQGRPDCKRCGGGYPCGRCRPWAIRQAARPSQSKIDEELATLRTHRYVMLPTPTILCTYRESKCGCQVVGNGTIPHPLEVKLCKAHKGLWGFVTKFLDEYELTPIPNEDVAELVNQARKLKKAVSK